MDITGHFFIHAGEPHLFLNSFPAHLLSLGAEGDVAENSEGRSAINPIEGLWSLGNVERPGYALPLRGRLGDHGLKISREEAARTGVLGADADAYLFRFSPAAELLGWVKAPRALSQRACEAC